MLSCIGDALLYFGTHVTAYDLDGSAIVRKLGDRYYITGDTEQESTEPVSKLNHFTLLP